MLVEHLTAWTLAAMSSFAAREPTPAMHRLAADIAHVAIERPVLGGHDRTAAMLASIAASESGGFRDEVLDCRVRGDQGRSRGAFQVWGGPLAICTDWRAGAHLALTIAERSIRICGTLAAYVSGHCDRATWLARRYEGRAERWLVRAPLLAPVESP